MGQAMNILKQSYWFKVHTSKNMMLYDQTRQHLVIITQLMAAHEQFPDGSISG